MGIKDFLENFEKSGAYPDFHSISKGVNEPVCEVDGKEYLMFAANNYLGMTQDGHVKTAAKIAIDKYGLGPGGSRVIAGNVDIIEKLEQRISNLVGSEDCLTFPTGYMANITVFQALMDPLFMGQPQESKDGIIFSDEYNHGSIVDGCRLSGAKKVIFKHNDLNDLNSKLKEFADFKNKLIVTEGVFSLDGEIINVPEYVELAKNFGARLMIDDAHGVGIFGEHGGGVLDHYRCSKDVDIIMGCMDKAMGGTGGYLAGSKEMVKYLRIACRSSLLSSAITTVMAGGMIASIDLIARSPERRITLLEKSKYLRERLTTAGFTILGKDNIPAIPLYIGLEEKGITFSKLLWGADIFLPIVRWPAVPQGKSRFRIIVMVNHSYEQLDKLVESSIIIGKNLGII